MEFALTVFEPGAFQSSGKHHLTWDVCVMLRTLPTSWSCMCCFVSHTSTVTFVGSVHGNYIGAKINAWIVIFDPAVVLP
eukprot:5915627-Amphidinium_carterae.1